MAYDRYDTRPGREDYRGGSREDRGFFERAGDEIASWFGDEDAERRRRQDERMNRDSGPDRNRNRDYDRGYGRDYDRDRGQRAYGQDRSRNRGRPENDQLERGFWPEHGYLRSEYDPDYEARSRGSNQNRDRDRDQGRGYWRGGGSYGGAYDYGGSTATGWAYGSNSRPAGYDEGRGPDRAAEYSEMNDRSGGNRWRDWDRNQDEFRRTGYSGRGRQYNPDYQAWRQRHLDELDRDYDQYCRENQQKFENEFGSWREDRTRRRGLLGQVREHMDVVGSDGEHVGTVDCVRGDRIVLTKSDSPNDHHHSIPCSMLDQVDGDKVVLDLKAEEAKKRWRDDETDRALFEPEGQGESGAHDLNRSFAGTYR